MEVHVDVGGRECGKGRVCGERGDVETSSE